jgi:hypothetical protein
MHTLNADRVLQAEEMEHTGTTAGRMPQLGIGSRLNSVLAHR